MPFVPGQSGNPKGGGGYSRHAVRFAEKLRAGPVDDALKALERALNDEEGSVQVAAAKEILARGLGKALEHNITLADFSDEEIWAELERRFGIPAPKGANQPKPVNPA